MEPRTMKITTIDDTEYLKLCDVERLLHDMRREILDNSEYEIMQDGTRKYHHTESEMARLNDLYFVSSCLKRELVLSCESPDEIRALHEHIRKSYYRGKYYLSQPGEGETGKPVSILYFRKYCPGAMKARLEEEGKSKEEIEEALRESEGDPAFTTDSKYAFLFESLEEAEANRSYLNHNYNMNLKSSAAFLLDTKSGKALLDKLLDKLLKDDGEGNA